MSTYAKAKIEVMDTAMKICERFSIPINQVGQMMRDIGEDIDQEVKEQIEIHEEE